MPTATINSAKKVLQYIKTAKKPLTPTGISKAIRLGYPATLACLDFFQMEGIISSETDGRLTFIRYLRREGKDGYNKRR